MNSIQPTSIHGAMSAAYRQSGGTLKSGGVTRRSSYPIHSFPGQLYSIARDLSAGGGVAPEIVGTTLIVVASLLTQGLADVTWPNGRAISIGANGLVVSPSGSGKTMPYDWLKAPIEKYLEQLTAADPEGKHDGLLHEDPTREALVQSLKDWPVAGLLTDEGGIVKRLLKDSATLVKLLDGASLRYSRVSSDRVTLIGQRLCLLLMEQLEPFDEIKQRLGGRKGGVGMINRFLVMRLMGLAEGSPHDVRLSDDVALAYEKRVYELLDALVVRVKEGRRARPALKLRADASPCLVEISHDARRRCTEPDSPWADISEYVLRHAERVLRLAGVFHVFEYGPEGEISLDTLEGAESFCNWYVDSYRDIFCEEPKPTQTELDADALGNAFVHLCQATGRWVVPQAELRTWAVNLELTGSRFPRALGVLCRRGRVAVFPGRNGPQVELSRSSVLLSQR